MAAPLVLGHSGLLGQALLQARPNLLTIAGGRDAFDLTRGLSHISRALEGSQAQVCINCIAMANVDACERHPDSAMLVNATAVGHLAQACARLGIRLVHLSTDYVFDGQQHTPYRESDPPRPLSAYGASKLRGEELALQYCPQALVVRTAWVFGPGKESFVERPWRQYLAGQSPIRVVDDQVSSPTWAPELARALLQLAASPFSGILHVAGSGHASRLALAQESFRLLGLNPELIQPAPSSDFPGAPRPGFSPLDSSQAQSLLGWQLMDWQQALQKHWQQLRGSSS